jgi:hypothetical protein
MPDIERRDDRAINSENDAKIRACGRDSKPI